MEPIHRIISAVGTTVILSSCSSIPLLQEPRVLEPNQVAMTAGVWVGTQAGIEDMQSSGDNTSRISKQSLELLYSGRVGVAKDYDLGASILLSGLSAYAFGADIKRQVLHTPTYAAAVSVGCYYHYDLFGPTGIVNTKWSMGSDFFVVQTEARIAVANTMAPRYGLSAGIALRIPLDSTRYSAAFFGVIGGIHYGREEHYSSFALSPVGAWLRFGIQYQRLLPW